MNTKSIKWNRKNSFHELERLQSNWKDSFGIFASKKAKPFSYLCKQKGEAFFLFLLAKNSEGIFSNFALILVSLALMLSLSAGWTELTLDNETYYLVPPGEVQLNHTIKGVF